MPFTFLTLKIPVDVFIGESSITTGSKKNSLGIIIDSDFSFDKHAYSLFSKASKKLLLLENKKGTC